MNKFFFNEQYMRDMAGETRTNSLNDVLQWTDQQKLTYNSTARTQDLVWKVCRKRWMIGMDG